ncbi:MAG: response regulator [Candidatus Omnitrophica bacterium]|nr:response regulator [Candidatus Omnitrophota bacterium]
MAKRILIADDEPTVVALAKEKLEEQGYVVATARNGKEAWEIIQNAPVDLIVTDVIMPMMDGVDLYKEIKKTPRLAGIPIVIITDNRIFRESFQTLGVEHFLPKPLDATKLIHKVEYIFTCAELDVKNKQCLVLGASGEVNDEMVKILQAQSCVVGASTDPIEFISNCLILRPRVIFVDILIKGDIPSREVIEALKRFTRLGGMEILVFTQFAPEDIGSMQGIEELRQSKNDCLESGATKYIGRFTRMTFWDMVKDSFD